jgi:alpha/beta superfamily hydrolase
LRRAALGTLAGLLVTTLIALTGIAWYFSGLAIAVSHTESRDVTATPGPAGTVTLSLNHYATLPGRYGLEWDSGYAQVGAVEATTATTVSRSMTPALGVLAPGTKVDLDAFAYPGDPRTGVGLAYQDVQVHGPLGDYPAWYVPASGAAADRGRTWVVFVHGHDSNRRESLRYLRTWNALGLPVLVPSYRNDLGAPASPDGADHLGDTEWRDVEAAVRWAMDAGARNVVLAGWSMGGAVGLQFVDRSPLGRTVIGLLLDSPVLDWRDVFDYQAAERGLPAAVTAIALWTVERRTGVDLDRFDWVARSTRWRLPALIFASDGDTYVPNRPAVRLAQLRPDLVQLVDDPRADHTRSWNVDPTAYDATMTQWLRRITAPAP